MNSLVDDQLFERMEDIRRGPFHTGPIGRRLISFSPLILVVRLLKKSMGFSGRVKVGLERRLGKCSELIVAA